MFPTAYDADNLAAILESNSSTPDWVEDRDVQQRIIEHAQQRASTRVDSALEDHETDVLITTDWNGYTDDWGFSGGSSNQVALATLDEEVSAAKDAYLTKDTVILQTDWLRSGDGRKTQASTYVDEDYGGDDGVLWTAKGAAEYVAIVELSNELLHGEVDLSEAM